MTEEHTISLQPGTVIDGKYEVVKCLGAGSMGLVYACRNRNLGQIVAVKVLFPEVATDKVASARFKNEILASYEVSHPNVVRAYDYIHERDLVAYSMEYVGGGDLASKLGADEPMSIAEIVRMLAQMAAGCQAIHDAGIVHRDLKPENILLTSEGNVKIADFGIARNRHGPKLTEHGGVVGTVEYVAPEYMLRSQVDSRSDIYALGILAYEMVTGESPFRGENVYAAMTKRLKTDPEPPSKLRSECPAELDRIILKAMQREPEKRYQAAREMFADLQNLGSELGISTANAPSVVSAPVSDSLGEPQPLVDKAREIPAAPTKPPTRSPSSARLQAELQRHMRSNGGGGGSPVASRTPPPRDELRGDSSRSDVLEDSNSAGRQKTGTEVLEEELVGFMVDTDGSSDSPYAAPEPLIPSAPTPTPNRGAPAPQSRGLRPTKSRAAHAGYGDAVGESRWGEVLALLVAAAVGIGCGFIFLKIFAPSLLEKWNL